MDVDKPKHGEITMASERTADGYRVTTTLHIDMRRVGLAVRARLLEEGK